MRQRPRRHARGVRALCATWPDYSAEGFDVVLFTRSLHHIERLGEAVEKASSAVKPGGRIMVEDFAFHEADHNTVCWFRALLEQLHDQQRLAVDESSFASRILRATDPIGAWHHGSDHIHPALQQHTALRDYFRIDHVAAAPYLYRYLAPLLREPTPESLDAIVAEECRAAALGQLTLIGRRYVGTRVAT